MQYANEIRPGTSPAAAAPQWYQMYFAAVLEADEWKALIEMERADSAIRDRLHELAGSGPENAHEVQDLNCALIYLRLLIESMDERKKPLCR